MLKLFLNAFKKDLKDPVAEHPLLLMKEAMRIIKKIRNIKLLNIKKRLFNATLFNSSFLCFWYVYNK